MSAVVYTAEENKKFSARRKEINSLTDCEWAERWKSICRRLRKNHPEAIKNIYITDGVRVR